MGFTLDYLGFWGCVLLLAFGFEFCSCPQCVLIWLFLVCTLFAPFYNFVIHIPLRIPM